MNALEVLADDLNEACYDISKEHGLLHVIKAKSIIRELAKIRLVDTFVPMHQFNNNVGTMKKLPSKEDCYKAVLRCMEIAEGKAEEGSGK